MLSFKNPGFVLETIRIKRSYIKMFHENAENVKTSRNKF